MLTRIVYLIILFFIVK